MKSVNLPPALLTAERQRFLDRQPRSLALAQAAQQHFLFGVPLHWMRDWPTPATLFVHAAQGATLTCADGQTYADFCLGDTGAMFGHSPAPLAQAIAAQAARGLTCMLPAEQAPEVGALLAHTFGLPLWQMALTASDANRFVLRWARALTQRPQLLVFDGCYHGAVDDTLVDRDPATGGTLPDLRADVQQLREDLVAAMAQNASYSQRTAKALERAMPDGDALATRAAT